MRQISLAITGASGSIYAIRLLKLLLNSQDIQVHLCFSRAAQVVLKTELNLDLPANFDEQKQFFYALFNTTKDKLKIYEQNDWFSPMASGSANIDAMVICPASSGTLSAIATGASNNLIQRAADVILKERQKLILVHRETPLSQAHLENMLKITQMGAVILPASPGFYNQPKSIDALVDFIVARILKQLDIEQDIFTAWGKDK